MTERFDTPDMWIEAAHPDRQNEVTIGSKITDPAKVRLVGQPGEVLGAISFNIDSGNGGQLEAALALVRDLGNGIEVKVFAAATSSGYGKDFSDKDLIFWAYPEDGQMHIVIPGISGAPGPMGLQGPTGPMGEPGRDADDSVLQFILKQVKKLKRRIDRLRERIKNHAAKHR